MKIKKQIKLSFKSAAEITEFYRSQQFDYPKFFKMDGLSKLGFLASEMILNPLYNTDSHQKSEDSDLRQNDGEKGREDIAVICFNRSSSLETDTQYQATISDNENYFPSPSLFVYTLPNIVAGEIAIRNKFYSETFFYICKKFDARQIVETVKGVFREKTVSAALVAWIECFEEKREVLMFLVEKEKNETDFTEENIIMWYND
jgi:3-oxoacyl-[acyl-carrier-protein] synthase-1